MNLIYFQLIEVSTKKGRKTASMRVAHCYKSFPFFFRIFFLAVYASRFIKRKLSQTILYSYNLGYIYDLILIVTRHLIGYRNYIILYNLCCLCPMDIIFKFCTFLKLILKRQIIKISMHRNEFNSYPSIPVWLEGLYSLTLHILAVLLPHNVHI